jgi:hypothetical protein
MAKGNIPKPSAKKEKAKVTDAAAGPEVGKSEVEQTQTEAAPEAGQAQTEYVHDPNNEPREPFTLSIPMGMATDPILSCWEGTSFSKYVQRRLARMQKAAAALSTIESIIEADKQNLEEINARNSDHYEYEGLSVGTLDGLGLAKGIQLGVLQPVYWSHAAIRARQGRLHSKCQ